jgi:hypothetical protein
VPNPTLTFFSSLYDNSVEDTQLEKKNIVLLRRMVLYVAAKKRTLLTYRGQAKNRVAAKKRTLLTYRGQAKNRVAAKKRTRTFADFK